MALVPLSIADAAQLAKDLRKARNDVDHDRMRNILQMIRTQSICKDVILQTDLPREVGRLRRTNHEGVRAISELLVRSMKRTAGVDRHNTEDAALIIGGPLLTSPRPIHLEIVKFFSNGKSATLRKDAKTEHFMSIYTLSNFFECQVYFDGLLYPSSEHAYQAQYFPSHEGRFSIDGDLGSWDALPRVYSSAKKRLSAQKFWPRKSMIGIIAKMASNAKRARELQLPVPNLPDERR